MAWRLESQNGCCSPYLTSLEGKVREWLFLDSQQMSQVSWTLIGSHVYIPELITLAQAKQYTDWPSFDYCSPFHVELETSPTLAWFESGKGEPLKMISGGRRGMDAGKANVRYACLCLLVPPLPLCLLFHGRKSPVLMSGWVEEMLIFLTGELCTQKGHLHSAQYD